MIDVYSYASLERFASRVCDILGLDYATTTEAQLFQTIEELQWLAVFGELPERWTTTNGKENEKTMRNMQRLV